MKPLFTSVSALFLASAVFTNAQDQPNGLGLSLAAPIADHMVLQQGKETSVWGLAAPGSQVTVSFADQTRSTESGSDGKWEVTLSPLSMQAEPQSMVVASGRDSITVADVLVGEVWMCSGQSNMGWTLSKSAGAEEAIAAADYPLIRLFNTARETSAKAETDCSGKWEVCSPQTAGDFSGVGFFFGRDLAEALGDGVPIGLINTAWGGKPSEAFTSRAKLATIPAADRLLEEWDELQANYDHEETFADYEQSLAAWQARVRKMIDAAKEEGKPRPKLPRRPVAPSAPNLNSNFPGAISNRMIEPWTNYAIAGAIWYQGESNQWRAKQYQDIFPALIEDWRARWDDDFPFYFVQLANYTAPSTKPGTPSHWAELQEAQTLTLRRVPGTGMAVINDIGEANDIHPRNKEDVGKRLARWARAEVYGDNRSPICGPLYQSHRTEGAEIVVEFDHVGKGLKSRDGKSLQRFEIAGEDRKFVWGRAEIREDGRSLAVSSEEVAQPVAVRYAWAANPEGANLVNSAGLPASLFRTDDWEMVTADVQTFRESQEKRQVANRVKALAALEERGWNVLFNGKDLEGWKNPYDHGEARVVDGEIHLKANKKFFLCTQESFRDFTFVGEVLLPEGKANSGFMFRCHVEPNKVYGYQAEVDGSDRRWSGGLYDEGRRQWIWPSQSGRTKEEKFLLHEEESKAHFAQSEVRDALKRNDWNKYEITCKGDLIIIKVNGVGITRIRDDLDAEGHIAIQHHGEDGQIYRFRNLYLREEVSGE